MKKLILNEDKLNVLLEYAGFVSGWQKLIEHIYQYSMNNLLSLIRKYVPIQNRKGSKEDIFYYFETHDDVDLDYPMKSMVIPENHLNMLKISGIGEIVVEYIIDDNLGGAFDSSSMTINHKTNKLNGFTIILNLKELFLKEESFKQTIQHELTHAYEMMKRYKQHGTFKTDNDFENKFYSTNIVDENNKIKIVQAISYFFSKREMNAVVSEIAYMLRQYNPKTEQECWDLINKNHNSTFLYNINAIVKSLTKNPQRTIEIMDWIKENPQHSDMFPSIERYKGRPQAYQRRLIKVAQYKLNYITQKINKVIKVYLQEKSGVR